jgi:hypothetical protein
MIDTKHLARLTIMAFAVVAVVAAPSARAQESPIEIELSGDMMPGGSVTATVAMTDGSTIQSVSWSQTGGVTATLSGADTDTVTATLGAQGDYKAMLVHVLAEPPITADQLPPNVPAPDGEFPGGLQDRFQVVGVNPFALEEAALVVLSVDVTSSSGTYTGHAEIHTDLPWGWTTGVRNVAIDTPVLLHGKDQASYDWTLSAPDGSSATLMDAATQNPELTPDVAGEYELEVTDLATDDTVEMTVYAGTWRGIIEDMDAEGRPVVSSSCEGCHSESVNAWAQTGHAEIFTDQLNQLPEDSHYATYCFDCHTVGYDLGAVNEGIDEAEGYDAFLDEFFPIGDDGRRHPATDENTWAETLERYPEVAKKGNVQCENCHGPQTSEGHTEGFEARSTLSSDMCATCHGEPLRHGRFQQWQLSGHANYEVAIEESQSGTCSKCHTGNGFLAWLPVLNGDVAGDPSDSVDVRWTADEAHPQTCQTCHDPHAIGTASGEPNNATVRISDDTPELLAGFTATDVGRGAICMTCHNTRRGLRNDQTYTGADNERAPHSGAQTDVLMGENAYFVSTANRGFHSQLTDTCATCHMESTPPPDVLSYNQGGSNHTFFARPEICADCHNPDFLTAETVQTPVAQKLAELKGMIEDELLDLLAAELNAGGTIDLNGEVMVTSTADVTDIVFTSYHGRQAMALTLASAGEVGPFRMNDIDVIGAGGDAKPIYSVASDFLPKAGWNYHLIESDGSLGVHNPSWVSSVLDLTITAIETGDSGGGVAPGSGGVMPVSCTSDYYYWTEIAAHLNGAEGSVWRTDLVAKNRSAETANVELYLHTESDDLSLPGTVDPLAQGVFEDVVTLFGVNDKGTLEICSDQPLEVVSRIYNVSEDGTFGQYIDGFNGGGLMEGDTARLIGLRQMQGEFRTNISVTNTGTEDAEVEITLYGTDGSELDSYTLAVGVGMLVQDLQPFASRAEAPNAGWGFATVEVTSGGGVLASASVIDSRTNDATTIPMKR